MKIGIDISQTAFRGSGVDRYTRSLIDALLTHDKENQYVFFYSSLRLPIDPCIKKRILDPHILKEYRFPPTLLSLLWNSLHIVPIEWLIGHVDIFMSSDWVEPPSTHAIKVTTLHDMVVYRYPQTAHPFTTLYTSDLRVSPNIVAQQKKRHKWVIRESGGVFVDSMFTKKEIIDILHPREKKIHVIYPAVEVVPESQSWEYIREKYNISKPFILTVGKREPRKNIDKLAKAFIESYLHNTELLIVGEKGWGNLDGKYIQGIRFLGYVPDEDLASLYAHALFFIFPSLYEGFGYPIVEAMGYGCPTATSNTSSLVEVADGASLLFDPTDAKDITKNLKTLATNAALRKALVKKGTKRYAEFSKKKFATRFVKIVSDIYHDNRS